MKKSTGKRNLKYEIIIRQLLNNLKYEYSKRIKKIR